jgi:hypothetical protein
VRPRPPLPPEVVDARLDRLADAYERCPPKGSALWWEQAYADLWERRKRAEERARVERELERVRASHSTSDPIGRASKYLALCESGVSGQGRNPTAFNVVVRVVRGFALSEHEALSLLGGEYAPRCQPRLPYAELRGMVRRARRATSPPWGYLLERKR